MVASHDRLRRLHTATYRLEVRGPKWKLQMILADQVWCEVTPVICVPWLIRVTCMQRQNANMWSLQTWGFFFVSQYFMWFVALLIVPNDSRCLRLTCLFCFGHFAPQVARCLSSSSKWWFGTASGRHARVSVWQNGRKLCTENDLRLANKRRMPQPSG